MSGLQLNQVKIILKTFAYHFYLKLMFRLNLFRLSNKDVFVIPHLYGELAQHRMGIKLIQDKV